MPFSLNRLLPNALANRYRRQRDIQESNGSAQESRSGNDREMRDRRSPVFNGAELSVKKVQPSLVQKSGKLDDGKNQSPACRSLPASTTDARIASLLTTEKEKQSFDKLPGQHRDYLCSEEGIAALELAKRAGRTIDFEAFEQVPVALLEPNERFPSPLFRLATSRFVNESSAAHYSDALSNALKCNLFEITQKGDQGRNPIHVAALHGNIEALEGFAKHDEAHTKWPQERALSAVAGDNCTPMECVFIHAPGNGMKAAEALLQAGADLAPRANAHGPIQLAVKSFRPDLVAFATTESLKRGILYAKDGKGRTPHQARRDWLKDARRNGDLNYDAIKGHLESYKAASESQRRSPPTERASDVIVVPLEQ
jgi:hypothetical protein